MIKTKQTTKPQLTQQKKLRTNPFATYRDPKTGRWVVHKPAAA